MLDTVENGGASFPRGCYLISIDASPEFLQWKRERSETREFPQDYLFDRNASDAIDYVLLKQREKTLELVGMTTPDVGDPIGAFSEWTSSNGTLKCKFWHVALRRVYLSEEEKSESLGIRWDMLPWKKQIRLIPTELNIWDWQQGALFKAADYLVEEGWHAQAGSWFSP